MGLREGWMDGWMDRTLNINDINILQLLRSKNNSKISPADAYLYVLGTDLETSFVPTSRCRLKRNKCSSLYANTDMSTATYAIQLVSFSKAPNSAKEGQAVGLFISSMLWYLFALLFVLHGDNAPQRKKNISWVSLCFPSI